MSTLASLCLQQIAARLHQLAEGGPSSHAYLSTAAQLPVHLRQQLIESLNTSGHLNDLLLHGLASPDLTALVLPHDISVSTATLLSCIKVRPAYK